MNWLHGYGLLAPFVQRRGRVAGC